MIVETFEKLNSKDRFRTLKSIAEGLKLYGNLTGAQKCIDFEKEFSENQDLKNMDILVSQV